jgi:hypothetical protein
MDAYGSVKREFCPYWRGGEKVMCTNVCPLCGGAQGLFVFSFKMPLQKGDLFDRSNTSYRGLLI